ncbi:hypothetical protein ACFT7S_34450 [Streptomyces sp. NPDC057136]|uniref:hypothetical protein n=1 Tax=Streptomyces sp. NPDC057136 TaxID=3346029 RepID=UPI00362E829C
MLLDRAGQSSTEAGNRLVVPAPPWLAPASDSLFVRAPAGGERWNSVERRQISWRITGGLGYPCSVLLERRSEQGTWSPAAVLAVQVDPRALGASVVVPELPSGPYRVRITSPELPYDVCSPPLTISLS